MYINMLSVLYIKTDKMFLQITIYCDTINVFHKMRDLDLE